MATAKLKRKYTTTDREGARVSGSATDVASIYDHGWKMADASRRGLRDGNAGRVSVDG